MRVDSFGRCEESCIFLIGFLWMWLGADVMCHGVASPIQLTRRKASLAAAESWKQNKAVDHLKAETSTGKLLPKRAEVGAHI